jgi:hypothetical protein
MHSDNCRESFHRLKTGYKPLIIAIFYLVIGIFAVFKFGTVKAADQTTVLFNRKWNFSGRNSAAERYLQVDKNVLAGKKALQVTYDLNGTCLLGGDASAVIFDQAGDWRFSSLNNYGKNCYDGKQTVEIPLRDFNGLNTDNPVGLFHMRIWNRNRFSVEVTRVALVSGETNSGSVVTPTPTPTVVPSTTPVPTMSPTPKPTVQPTVLPTVAPTATPKPTTTPTIAPTATPVPSDGGSWQIQSVSSMKETKDRICSPREQQFIEKWVDTAKELGANYVAVETPYDNPSCGDAAAYTKQWVDVIRSRGMKVWHRHMGLAFEGIYDVTKSKRSDYLSVISNYIKNNPGLFAEGDIFTPTPEPQNGGISGITYCANGVCQFDNAAEFNRWLRDAIDTSNSAFSSIGLGGKIKLGYYGFDGFVAWGSNNPDWNGILEDETVKKMGNITIDHYPELIGETMTKGLSELEARYPGTPIVIGEWGSVGDSNHERQVIDSMGASKRSSVIGFNYWHMGMSGNEALINDDFSKKPQFDEVQSFFKGNR